MVKVLKGNLKWKYISIQHLSLEVMPMSKIVFFEECANVKICSVENNCCFMLVKILSFPS